jgi:hypothetical protein
MSSRVLDPVSLRQLQLRLDLTTRKVAEFNIGAAIENGANPEYLLTSSLRSWRSTGCRRYRL